MTTATTTPPVLQHVPDLTDEPTLEVRPRVVVVMPALNAAKTLEMTVGSISRDVVAEIILVDGKADLVLGSRMAEPGAAEAGGMPKAKIIANRALTAVENLALGTRLSEMHTGYRAYSRELLLTVPFLRNSLGFSFDSEMLMQAVHFGFRIAEVPCATRYFVDASSIGFNDATTYGVKTAWMAGRYLLNRWGALPCRRFAR